MGFSPPENKMDDPPQAEGGLLSTLTRMIKALRHGAGSRIELLIADWHEERLRLLDIVVLVLIGALSSFMVLLLVTFAIVAAFWKSHPIPVMIALILFYLAITSGAMIALRRQIQRLGVFTSTLEQIKKDLACFKEKS